MGLSERAFWSSTLVELNALYDRVRVRERRADLRLGLLTAVVRNALRTKGGRVWKPQDFLLDPDPLSEARPSARALVEKIKWAMGGIVPPPKGVPSKKGR